MARARNPNPDTPIAVILAQLAATGSGAPSLADKVELVRVARAGSPEDSAAVDDFLLRQCERYREGLAAATKVQGELRALLEKVTKGSLQLAVFLGRASAAGREGAWVQQGATTRIAWATDDVDLGTLVIGDEVLVGGESGVIVAAAPARPSEGGELATFTRYASGRRLVLSSRDEEIVALATRDLDATHLVSGDLVRWERVTKLAWEKIERAKESIFLERTPDESFDDVGGLDEVIEHLRSLLLFRRDHAALAARYGLRPVAGILFNGPSGTGKTLLARALAHECAVLSPSGRSRFGHCKPGGLNSPWFGETERAIRETFQRAREAAEAEPGVPTVLFWDEIDALGSARGESLGRVDDRIVQAFFSELDGLEARGDILVIGATNRIDALDPALVRPGRLGDRIFHIPRPNRKAARQILGKHLVRGIPVAPNGHGEEDADRASLIESALARIYAASEEGDLLHIGFRDGRRDIVRAKDLVSGAVIARIVRDACETACRREIETGRAGVRLEDVLAAIDDAFTEAASAITPRNCRRHLVDLPQDVDVVSVRPVERKVKRPHRYLRSA